MTGYFYIMSDRGQTTLHLGVCPDLNKMLAFYKKMPTTAPNESYLLKLVYIEQYQDKNNAMHRFNEVTLMNSASKEAIIVAVNPDYIELIPGINIQL